MNSQGTTKATVTDKDEAWLIRVSRTGEEEEEEGMNWAVELPGERQDT